MSAEAAVGKYVLEVGPSTASSTQFASARSPEERARARENAASLRAALSEPEETRPPAALEAVEQVEDTAQAVTGRIEHANDLFEAVTRDGLLDRDFVTGEIGALLGLLQRLDREGRFEEELRLAKALHGLCVLAFRWLDLVRSLRAALGAARAVGDEAGQAWALNELGALHLCAGEAKRAEAYLEHALALQERVGDAAGRCAARRNLDNAKRDAARPVQLAARRGLVALASVAAAIALGGGAAIGVLVAGPESAQAETAVSLRVQASGAGTGTVHGNRIVCGEDCHETFSQGVSARLTAEADVGSVFERWDGAECSEGQESERCTLQLDDDAFVVALFAQAPPKTLKLTVGKAGDGAGSVSGGGIRCDDRCVRDVTRGASVRLVASAAAGSVFDRWGGGVSCREGQGATTCTVRPKADVVALAFFAQQAAATAGVTVEKRGDGDGLVAGEGIVCGDDCRADVVEGTTVTLTAAADANSLFMGWEEVRCVRGPTCTFLVESPVPVGARFDPAVYLLAAVVGSGDVTTNVPGVECGQGCFKFPRGTSVTITAVPREGWLFSHWLDPSCRNSRSGPCSLDLSENTTVTPVFDPNPR